MPIPSSSRRTSSWFLLIVSNALFATGYIAAKFLLQDLSVLITLALRFGIAALALFPLLIVKRHSLHLTRRDLPQLALLVLTGFVINQLLEYAGLALSTAADVALLITSEAIFTALLSCWLLREQFKRATGIALILGSLGMYLIIEQGLIPHLPGGGGTLRILGDVLVIAGLISESYYTVRGKALLTKYPPFLITAAALVGSLVFWAPVASWQVLSFGWHPLNLISWLSLVWLAVIATALAYLTWFQGLTRIEGSKAASALFIQPLVGTILAVVLLHEQLTVITIVGGVLIGVSVYLISQQ
ncbi:MAG TPA: DMT family transporter [Ktedonobacteraceae bacterium]